MQLWRMSSYRRAYRAAYRESKLVYAIGRAGKTFGGAFGVLLMGLTLMTMGLTLMRLTCASMINSLPTGFDL